MRQSGGWQRFLRRLGWLAVMLTLLDMSAAHADLLMPPAFTPGMQCRVAIGAAERAQAIPTQLLAAIGRVESGRRDPATGDVDPWPWTINVEGQGHLYETKAEAIAAVRSFQAQGAQSIDVGCMQINLMHHPNAFASLEEAFDPAANANYAAHFLNDLFAQSQDWHRATAMYHSATPEIGDDYERRVMAALPEEMRRAGMTAGLGFGGALVRPNGAAPLGRFAAMVPMRPPVGGHVILLPVAMQAAGRTLAAYRAMPVLTANPRPFPRG